ncbi:MAG TPA: DUF2877 domain-containing protein [Verrucomicrobiae bacterium]|nr:DUF2877 domain-containing protein [Verrucomicrobiae bacterium]
MRLVSIGDQIEEGIYPFHSRFHRAVNFRQGDRLVSVVHEQIGDGPLNIVLREFDAGETQNALEVGTDRINFDGRTLPFASQQRYCSVLNSHPGPHFREKLVVFRKILLKASHPKSLTFLLDDSRIRNFSSGFERAFARQVKFCVDEIFHGDRLNGVRTLAGCGIGLTPSGDDFIAGYLIGLNLGGTGVPASGQTADEVFEAARSDNIFSNTFLDLARQGRLFGRMKNLILALMHDSERAVQEMTNRLCAIGGSSGADLGTGFYVTMCKL